MYFWIFPFTSLQSEPGGAPKFLSAKRYQKTAFSWEQLVKIEK
jgi:hypothetical protein